MAASPVYTRRTQRALGFEGDRPDDLQEHPARHRRAAISSWTSGTRSTTRPRRVLARPLRRADGRRADGRGLRARHVPRHRGPDVRRHRHRDQPPGPGPADPPAAARTGRPVARHCAWTVTISDEHPAVPVPEEAKAMAATRAATMELAPIDPDDQGRQLRRSARRRPRLRRLVRLRTAPHHRRGLSAGSSAGPLLPGGHGGPDGDVGGSRRVRPPRFHRRGRGVAAERFRHVLGLPPTLEGAATLLGLHPRLLPYEYVRCDVEFHERLIVRIGRDTGAMADGAWPSMLDADHLGPLDAIVRRSTTTLGASRCRTARLRPGRRSGPGCRTGARIGRRAADEVQHRCGVRVRGPRYSGRIADRTPVVHRCARATDRATPARRHHASPPGSGNLRAPPRYEPRRRRLGDPCTGDACRPDRGTGRPSPLDRGRSPDVTRGVRRPTGRGSAGGSHEAPVAPVAERGARTGGSSERTNWPLTTLAMR